MSVIVLATGNQNKVVEIQPLLAEAGFEAKLQTDFFCDEVEEDGLSFVENALKKARYASAKTGLPAMADDSGLEVDALNGAPGIFSARYANDLGFHNDDEQNLLKVLDQMQGLPYAQRGARYSCAVVYVAHEKDPMPIIGSAHIYGEILMEKRTQAGIGYDSIFWMPQYVKTLSEMTLEFKHRISHRADAVRKVLNQLKATK